MIATRPYPFMSRTRREALAEGEAKGKAEGNVEGEAKGSAKTKAADILTVFGKRGIAVDDTSRELIEACTDLSVLDGWFRRAFHVSKASDLFTK